MSNIQNGVLLRQMHKPAGRLTLGTLGQLHGEVFNGKEWVKDQPSAQAEPHKSIQTYSDIFRHAPFCHGPFCRPKKNQKIL